MSHTELDLPRLDSTVKLRALAKQTTVPHVSVRVQLCAAV